MRRPSIQEVKAAALGRWTSILIDAGMPADCLKPGGNPAHCAVERIASTVPKMSTIRSGVLPTLLQQVIYDQAGDGVATVAWLMKTTNGQAAKWIAERLGMNEEYKALAPVDIIAATCRDKRMPIEAFRLFGVKEGQRGKERHTVCRVDLYNETGVVHSHFDLWPGAKGRVKAGQGNSGLFFLVVYTVAGETWLAVEGVKDAAALVGIGYNAFGYCGNKLGTKYARLFEGVDVVVVPDLDTAGMLGADHTAGVLAASLHRWQSLGCRA